MVYKEEVKESTGLANYTNNYYTLMDICYSIPSVINIGASMASYTLAIGGLFLANTEVKEENKKSGFQNGTTRWTARQKLDLTSFF